MKKIVIAALATFALTLSAFSQKDEFAGFYKGTIEAKKCYPSTICPEIFAEVYRGPNETYRLRLVPAIMNRCDVFYEMGNLKAKDGKIAFSGASNYYDLKVDKVDELVAALKNEESAEGEPLSMSISDCTGVSEPDNYTKGGKEKQFDPYKTDFLGKIPAWIKAIFVKFWFAGAVCYFAMFGIGLSNTLDSLAITGIILGLVVDVLVNPLFRFMESDEREYDNFIMFPFPFKAYWTFFANIAYYVVVLVCVNYCYFGVNVLSNIVSGTEGNINVGVEPLLFGVFAVAVDMVFIGIKDGIVALVKHNKKKENENV